MLRLNRSVRVGLAALVSMVCLATPSAIAADGAPAKPKPSGGHSSSASLDSTAQGKPSGTVEGYAPSAAVPSGCWGYTDNVHASYSFASVHGRTECPFYTNMVVNTNLYRSRWWGWEYLANGGDSGYKMYTNANAKWYCAGVGTYTWLGESYHRVVINGNSYIAYTDNDDRWTC
ncbi:hypothetical protein [Terrabacter sp. NPDC080008]|uniref:hypothetical protein n=1 Tax=Terrabacter sp. NPDC080008 TaxID=3155176 RepID=UPI00345053C5